MSGPEAVRKLGAPTLVMPQAGSHEGSATADLAAGDGARDESPIGTSGIKEEGRTEGHGVEHEALEAQDETRIDQPFDPTRTKLSITTPTGVWRG